jgi:hypothetical protein
METESVCYLCKLAAEVDVVKGGGGQRFEVHCTGECPRYVITRLAIAALEPQPHRRPEVIEMIKALIRRNPSGVPVVRRGNGPQDVIVVLHSEEAEQDG